MTKCRDHHKDHHDCVEETLEAILEAQKKVKKREDCRTSCNSAIEELLGCTKSKKNTIPFILYCDCEPFRATGIDTFSSHKSKKKKFNCFTTFIFKIKDLDDHCAVLELLAFNSKEKHDPSFCKQCCPDDPCSPCCQVDHEDVDDLVKTGVCITVDLSCFCAITCLPAVTL